jgi:hypothetical protein
VRLTFLLDENIVYHAIRGVDKHDQPDPTAQELITAIAKICHGISVHSCMNDRYQTVFKKLREHPARSSAAVRFLRELLHNSSKRAYEVAHLPILPQGVQLPREDEEIVRAALISRPVIVTADEELEDAVNNHYERLGLQALDAVKALALAESEKP